VTVALAAEMIVAGGKAASLLEGSAKAQEAIHSGAAWERFRAMVRAQGGDVAVVDDPNGRTSETITADVHAPADATGYVSRIDALDVGRAMISLGAGRRTKEDAVDPLAGCLLIKRQGDVVAPGDVLARVTASTEERMDEAMASLAAAWTYGAHPSRPDARIVDRFADGVWTRS
jgi:pyrimidine-nucleoside phosphorylase